MRWYFTSLYTNNPTKFLYRTSDNHRFHSLNKRMSLLLLFALAVVRTPSYLLIKDQKTLVLSEDIDKSAIIYRPIRFVTHKRFAVLFSLPSYCVMCSSWKYPYSPHRRDWKFLGGGVSQRPKNLSKCMMLDWNFQRGGRSKKKSLPWGRYG